MKKVWVVVDWETRRCVRAFETEEAAQDFGDEYYLESGEDCLVSPVMVEE